MIGPDGEPYRGTARCRPAPADSGADQAAARLVPRLAEGRTGVNSTVVPALLWPAMGCSGRASKRTPA